MVQELVEMSTEAPPDLAYWGSVVAFRTRGVPAARLAAAEAPSPDPRLKELEAYVGLLESCQTQAQRLLDAGSLAEAIERFVFAAEKS